MSGPDDMPSVPAAGDAPPDSVAERAADLERRVRIIGESLNRARFAGVSPQIALTGQDDLTEAVARVLAADRFGAPLVVDGEIHHLHEEQALAMLRSAQESQRGLRFGEARSRLDRAAGMAADPGLQQRLGLWKLIVALVERLARADPTETARGDPARPILDALDAADTLPDVEREHYRAETRRVAETHATARREPQSVERALWYTARARLALSAGEPLAALSFCLQLGRLLPPDPPTDPYLGELLGNARQHALLSLGAVPDDEVDTVRKHVGGLQAWDVYRTLLAHLGPALGLDLQRETSRLTVEPYRDADD
jgi:hypothetical protein